MQVVAHNLESQFANRQLNITSKDKAKSTEKLSSGYRINRSADDAAGLQISEKMRWQIRGLDKTVDNCEAGSSFCEVADGAMKELEDIVHRMRELSVQAANDTNTLADRQAIQNEIDQLVVEVGRITSDTEFNTLSVFGWERSATNYKPSTTNPGSWVVSGPPSSSVVNGNNYGLGEILGVGHYYEEPRLDEQLTFDSSGQWSTTGQHKYEPYHKSVTADQILKEVDKYIPNSGITSAAFVSSNANTFEYNDYTNGYRFTIKFDAGLQTLDGQYPAQCIELEKGTYSIPNDPSSFVADKSIIKKEIRLADGSPGYNNGNSYGSAWLDFSGLDKDFILSDLYGLGFNTKCASCNRRYSINFTGNTCQTTANGVNYTYKNQGTVGNGLSRYPRLDINISDCKTGADIVDHIMKAVSSCNDFNNHYTQYAVNSTEPAKIYIFENRNDPNPDSFAGKWDFSDGGDSSFQLAAVNDKGQLEVGGETTANKGNPPTEKVVYANKNMWIQSGTTNLNGFFIERPLLSPGILGVTGLRVLDFEAASTAISACDGALTTINEQRSKVGAQQNRLESAILVNANTEENTQAAESRLRDTDMAEEMVNYSKSSILEQAGQAMLAQANQSKQNILSLFS